MTDQTIIDDAKAWLNSKEGNDAICDAMKELDSMKQELYQARQITLGQMHTPFIPILSKFTQLRDARAKASKQVQGEAIAIVDVEGKIWLNMTALNAIRKAGKEINLYASPQQPQTVADALEEAAKICDYQSKRHGDKANEENDEVECSILKSTAWQFSIAANDIRNLITTQPPIQGNIEGEK